MDARAERVWRVRLVGALEADDGAVRHRRFPSRAVALLLARLAMAGGASLGREMLVEWLWPGVDPATGRNRLRQALSALKGLLDGGARGDGAVLQADRRTVRVRDGAMRCDLLEAEQAWQAGRHDEARMQAAGEILPGLYDDWVESLRRRVAAWFEAPDTRPSDVPAAPGRVTAPRPLPPLPVWPTRLFGQEPVLARIAAAARASRLVVLRGPGGAGKTRLAVEAARRAGGAVVFVGARGCSDGAELRATLAATLGLPSACASDAHTLAQALPQPLCLVLDNLEPVAVDAARLLAVWLARCPLLSVLATTRVRLGVDGEHEVPLPGLPEPGGDAAEGGAEPDLGALARDPAVALFVDRAQAVQPGLRLDDGNAQALRRIVQRLGRLPLALELAAARMATFTPAALAEALDAGAASELLVRAGPRDGLDPRPASMEDTLAWSWALLDDGSARQLAALSVWAGAFDAELAAALERDEPPDAAARARAALALDALAAQSLLRVLPGAAGVRLVLLEPVREFVRTRAPAVLGADGLRGVHRRACAALDRRLRALPASVPVARLEAERDNWRGLLRDALADGDEAALAAALGLVQALRPRWDSDAALPAELQLVDAALERLGQAGSGVAAATRSDVHELLAYLHFGAGHAELARRHAEQALALAGDADGPRGRALLRRAWIELASQRFDAALEAPLREALARAEAAGDGATAARALHQLAILEHTVHRRLDAADALLARSQARWLAEGNRTMARARERSRIELVLARRGFAAALPVVERLEALALADDDWIGAIDAALLQGQARAGLRDWPAAAAALARAARTAAVRGHYHALAYALWQQAPLLARLGRRDAAVRLMAFAERFWRSHVGSLPPGGPRRLALWRRWLVTPAAALAWAEGATMPLAEAVAIASRPGTPPG